jgi:hypothetical protein
MSKLVYFHYNMFQIDTSWMNLSTSKFQQTIKKIFITLIRKNMWVTSIILRALIFTHKQNRERGAINMVLQFSINEIDKGTKIILLSIHIYLIYTHMLIENRKWN